MRGVTFTLLVGAVWLAIPEVADAQVRITGGGEYKDRKGIHVRAYSTFPSLVRLAWQAFAWLCTFATKW